METNIKQELTRTYLIAEDRAAAAVDFRFKMLLDNNIRGLLRCRENNVDDRIRIYYDITGMISLRDHCEDEVLRVEMIRQLITTLIMVEDECRDYMMNMSNISLNPDHIFLNNGDIEFCYLPWEDQNIQESFHALVTELLDIGDSADGECMGLLYELHGLTRQRYNLEDTARLVSRSFTENDSWYTKKEFEEGPEAAENLEQTEKPEQNQVKAPCFRKDFGQLERPEPSKTEETFFREDARGEYREKKYEDMCPRGENREKKYEDMWPREEHNEMKQEDMGLRREYGEIKPDDRRPRGEYRERQNENRRFVRESEERRDNNRNTYRYGEEPPAGNSGSWFRGFGRKRMSEEEKRLRREEKREFREQLKIERQMEKYGMIPEDEYNY